MQLEPFLQYFRLFQNIQEGSLSNGVLFYDLLNRIKQFPSVHINNKPETFIHKFSNLKSVYNCVEEYWRDNLGRQLECQQINLVEIAKNDKIQEIVKLAQLLLKTAIQSINKQYFIEKILKTSASTQQLFMQIIGNTINNTVDSPRKQKQKRLYDKIIELDHENDNLQQVLSKICIQKQQTENTYKAIKDTIIDKDNQIQKLNRIVGDILQTPNKKTITEISDNNDNNHQLIEILKCKMIQMSNQHQKQIIKFQQQIEFFSNKMERISQLEQTIQAYKEKIQDANAAINNYNNLENTIRTHLVTVNQQAEEIIHLKIKMDKLKDRINQFQQAEVEYRLEIQRKNLQIQEYMKSSLTPSSKEDNYLHGSLSIQKTLFQQCPEIINSQTNSLTEVNRTLRQQLQRTIKAFRINEVQLAKYKSESQHYKHVENQNIKLTKILKQQSDNKGEENDILMGCIYELRSLFKAEGKNIQTNHQLSKLTLIEKITN